MTFQVYRDDADEWRWRLVHDSNGNIIADSGEGYDNRSDCLHGIDLVRGSKDATIQNV